MASDYERIIQDNIRKRGEEFDDIGRFFAEQLYSDRTHFVYELLQNAEDALERRLARDGSFSRRSLELRLFRDRLELSHFGEPFNEDDVRGICDVLRGTKAEDASQIGRFGIGFKSVYAYTASPEIHSGEEHFRIERYIRPRATEPRDLRAGETLFIFPFDHPEISADQAFEQILYRLRSLGPRTLLFLRNVDGISWECETEPGGTYLREDSQHGDARRVTVVGTRESDSAVRQEDWLVFERRVAGREDTSQARVEAAFRLETDDDGNESIVTVDDSELVVFFPTEKETHLGFLIQGPYRTTPARDNIVYPDDWNERLVEETAALVVSSLHRVRDRGLLTASTLAVLPIHDANFPPGSPFRPIFESVREALTNQPLLPTQSGHFVQARGAKLARTAGLRELLSDGQLDHLLGRGHPLRWLSAEITYDRTPTLRRYLVQQLGIEEVTPETFARRLGGAFMARQTDEWVAQFYAFLDDQKALWRPQLGSYESAPLRNKPFLRLENLSHVPPFRDGGLPRAFLPTDEETELPTVRQTVTNDERARRFLLNLGLTQPDTVDEVIEKVLPKYGQGKNAPPEEEHARDLRKIMHALETDSSTKERRLVDELRDTPFLLAHSARTGIVGLQTPESIYIRSPELELYLEGNPNAWLLDQRYGRYLPQLERLGVKRSIPVRHRLPHAYGLHAGHVVISQAQSNHVRGLDGFDPDCEIPGLKHALSHITQEKAAYIWNVLLAPSVHQIWGIVQYATWKNFGNARDEEELSRMGTLVTGHAWLPDQNGNFKRPEELRLEELPEEFSKREDLAEALDMRASDVVLLADRLGVNSEDIDFMVKHREEFEAFRQELERREREQGQNIVQEPEATGESAEVLDYAEELREAFEKSGHPAPVDEDPPPPGEVGNPEIRRTRTQEQIQQAKQEEPPEDTRFFQTPRKIWESKDHYVRTFLLEQYRGQCQICAYTFPKRNGNPYFEGLYLVSWTKAKWIDRPGNVLCLCATCCAKFQHGSVEAEAVLGQIRQLRTAREGGNRNPSLRLELCGEPVDIEFSERHMIDLQEMINESV